MNYTDVWATGDANKSQVFILPIIGKKCSEFGGNSLPQCQFRNCFIGDNSKGIKNKILLLYQFTSDPLYLGFEDELEEHPLFESRYETDKFHTMFVFKVPEDRQIDYNKIIKGEYSKISEDFKHHILTFHGLQGGESNTGGVLYKTSTKKDQLEAKINEGLPRRYWTKIPEEIELEETFNDEIEYFQEKYKQRLAIAPNEGFNNEI